MYSDVQNTHAVFCLPNGGFGQRAANMVVMVVVMYIQVEVIKQNTNEP